MMELLGLDVPEYAIRYSPGIIFSGKVAGLKVNFINAKEADKEQVNYTYIGYKEESGKYENPNAYKHNGVNVFSAGNTKYYELNFPLGDATFRNYRVAVCKYNEQEYVAVSEYVGTDFEVAIMETPVLNIIGSIADLIAGAIIDNVEDLKNSPVREYYAYEIGPYDTWSDNAKDLYKDFKVNIKQKKSVTGKEMQSSAYILQDTVATWYKALRAIALVGLLSVLVYVGIRILISSTGQEKAKYKKMIADWVTAICILFLLQYIMLFITEIAEKISNVINVIGPKGEDELMSKIRSKIGLYDVDLDIAFAEIVMYLVLVIHTVMFTIQYLKRLLYMAFFTMIAPLIALTYPLDKIKDGQAQAFTTWIREYVFNALLQPMHLLLYYIFVQSAMNLVNENPLYAIAAIGFLLPAEKFFRKMFGFDKASSASPLGAAAGGALIMNAVNKMGQKAGKAVADKGGSGGGGNSIRTASGTHGVSIGSSDGGSGGGGSGGGGPTGGGPTGGGSGGGGPTGGGPGGGGPGGGGSGGGSSGGGGLGGGSFGQARRGASRNGPTMLRAIRSPRSVGNGLAAVGRKYVNRNTAKSAGRMARKGLVGAAGAALLGTVGFATGVATGDFGNALQYGAAGAAAGYAGANNLTDTALAGEKNLRETFKEGAIGQQEYNNLKADREFYQSDDFRQMVNDRTLTPGGTGRRSTRMRNAVQVYRDSGITDTSKIRAAMNAGLSPQEGAYAIKLADMIGRSGWNNKNVRDDFERRYRGSIPNTNGRADAIWNSIDQLL